MRIVNLGIIADEISKNVTIKVINEKWPKNIGSSSGANSIKHSTLPVSYRISHMSHIVKKIKCFILAWRRVKIPAP
jgi:hypothetical protein